MIEEGETVEDVARRARRWKRPDWWSVAQAGAELSGEPGVPANACPLWWAKVDATTGKDPRSGR